jgi:hypothetical protein
MMNAKHSDIRRVLDNPYDYNWSLQGFGMLRTWLDPDGIERLHIWDPGSEVAGVSTIHNHPWDFNSRIVSGVMTNVRYRIDSQAGDPYNKSSIRTGAGGHLLGDPEETLIESIGSEALLPGEQYSQLAEDFHESMPIAGTVTVITRSFRFQRVATTCWPHGTEWVTAEPRPATRQEIDHFMSIARKA